MNSKITIKSIFLELETNMTVSLINQTYTFDEYLTIEELATEKHEYKNG